MIFQGFNLLEQKTVFDNIAFPITLSSRLTIEDKNHINQLKSYMYGISEFVIDKAILIYWKYEIKEKSKIVTKCYYKIIDKSQENNDKTELNDIYKQIKNACSKKNYSGKKD